MCWINFSYIFETLLWKNLNIHKRWHNFTVNAYPEYTPLDSAIDAWLFHTSVHLLFCSSFSPLYFYDAFQSKQKVQSSLKTLRVQGLFRVLFFFWSNTPIQWILTTAHTESLPRCRPRSTLQRERERERKCPSAFFQVFPVTIPHRQLLFRIFLIH